MRKLQKWSFQNNYKMIVNSVFKERFKMARSDFLVSKPLSIQQKDESYKRDTF